MTTQPLTVGSAGSRRWWSCRADAGLRHYDVPCFSAYKSTKLPEELAILLSFIKTQGEIESAISEGMSRFQQEYMGRGPKDVHVHLINDLVVCRPKGVLTAAEEHLVKTLPADKGRDLLKQVRSHLMETARPIMEAMVQEITGTKVLTLHHVSTLTGEEVVLFTLAELPPFRETKKR